MFSKVKKISTVSLVMQGYKTRNNTIIKNVFFNMSKMYKSVRKKKCRVFL